MTKSESRVCDLVLLHRFRIPLALPSGPWTCRHTPATLSQASKSTMAKGRVLRGRIDTSQESWLLTPDLLQRFSRRESQSIVIRWGLESLMTWVISFKMTHIEEKSFSIGRDKLKWNNDSSPKSLMRTALKRFTFVMRASGLLPRSLARPVVLSCCKGWDISISSFRKRRRCPCWSTSGPSRAPSWSCTLPYSTTTWSTLVLSFLTDFVRSSFHLHLVFIYI